MPMTVQHVFTNPQLDGTNTQIVRPSDWNSAHHVSVSLASNEVVKSFSAGANSITSGALVFANSNGVSFGMDTAGQLTASHNALVQSVADGLYVPKTVTTSPNGFPDRTQVTLSWVDGTRTLEVAPIGASFDVWSNGVKYTKSTAQSVVIGDVQGAHYIYFDDSGTLVETTTFSTDIILRWGLAAIVYWDATNNKAVPDAQAEWHGTDWPSEMHLQQHVTVGVRYQDGIEPTLDTEQDGSADAHIEVATTIGYIWDEDIKHTIPARLATDSIQIMHRTGVNGDWTYTNSAGPLVLTAGTGRAAFNEYTGGSWQQTEMTDGQFGVIYLYAMPSITSTKRLVVVQGQAQYISQAEAGLAAATIPQLGAMPLNEMKLIAAIAFQTNSGYTNSVKSRTVRIGDAAGPYYVDWRYQSAIQVAMADSGISILADGVTFETGVVSFGNANGVSFVTSNGSIVGSHNAIPTANSSLFQHTSATSAITALAFPAADTTKFAGTGFSGTNISGTLNSNGLQLSVAPGGGGADGYNILAAGTQTAGTATTVNFANSNSISFGMSGNSQITASIGTLPINTISNPTGEALVNLSTYGINYRWLNGGVSTNATREAAFELDFGGPFAGHAVHIHEHGTATSATGHVLHVIAENTGMSALVVNATGPANGYFDGPLSFSGGTVPLLLGTAQSNSVANLNANYLQGRVSSEFQSTGNYLTTARASNDAIGLNTALTANGVSMTANSGGLSLNFPAFLTTAAQSDHSHGNPTLALTNLSGTTASASNGLTISLSAAAPGGGGAINVSAGTTSNNLQTIEFGNANGVSFGLNGSTLTASVNAGGGGILTWNSYIPQGMYPGSTASQTMGAMGVTSGSALFWPFILEDAVQFDHVMMGMNLSFATSTVSGQQTISFSYGLYSNNASTLSQISSNSFSIGVTNSSGSATVNLPMTTNTSGWGYGTTSGSASAQLQSLFGTAGVKLFELPFANTMSLNTGQYWFGVQKRYSSSSANIGISLGLQGNVVGPIVSRAPLGMQSSALTTNMVYKQPLQGMGPYTSTGSAGYGGTALPVSAMMTGIAHTMSIYPCLTFDKSL